MTMGERERFVAFYTFSQEASEAVRQAREYLHRSLIVGFKYELLSQRVFERTDGVDVELEFQLVEMPPQFRMNLAFKSLFPQACDVSPA